MGEVAVVGQQDQAGRLGVETTDRVEPAVPGRANQIDDGRAAVRVARGGNDAGRLVERVDDADGRRAADVLAVDLDPLLAADVAGRVGDHLAIDEDAPVEHELLGGSARGDARVGEMFGETHGWRRKRDERGAEAATIEPSAMDLDLLNRTLDAAGEPGYRAGQAWAWQARGAHGWDAMTDLSADLRARLAEQVPFSTLTLEHEATARDGTVKALFRTHDDRAVEAVLMRYRDGRRSLCLSSQSGCPLTCSFCATGAMKFGRNLTAWEILDQALHFRRTQEVDHCVFMGMGEPMMNLDNVLDACRRLPDLGITHRRTAISTVGWLPGIDSLTQADMPIRLALSLHAPDDALRSEIMPVNDRYPIKDVLAACERWYERRRRMVFIEYVMLAGVNDRYEQALALARLLDRRRYKVNLIPYNPTGSAYDGSSREAIAAFRDVLEQHGYNATVRLTRGQDIDAACGQLAAKALAG